MRITILHTTCALSFFVNLVHSKYPWTSFTTIPGEQSNAPSTAQFTSSANGLDAPHVQPINQSAWDWWYFDVVSEDQSYNFVITFFAAPATGFPLSEAGPNDITEAFLFLSTPENEALFSGPIPAAMATVLAVENGASGVWKGSGIKFEGTPDMSFYSVTIDTPSIGIKGFATFKSVAPAHYPCGPACGGETMEILPHIGWANAVPDAIAEVDLIVNGTVVQFSGVGYHDKNWGDQPFARLVGSWFWGHGRLGPYSIVWFDALTPAGVESVSSYVAYEGKIIGAKCSGITVRPSGANDTYPPHIAVGTPSGNLHIEADLGFLGTLVVDVVPSFNVVNAEGVYFRWTGNLTGGIQGKECFTGPALYEQFTLIP